MDSIDSNDFTVNEYIFIETLKSRLEIIELPSYDEIAYDWI